MVNGEFGQVLLAGLPLTREKYPIFNQDSYRDQCLIFNWYFQYLSIE
jgi:hypothetical protein